MKLPFSTEQFFEIIEKYNDSVFPAQLVFILLGAMLIFLLHSERKYRNILIGNILAFFWLWMGLVYHFIFFTRINKAAFLFGALFVLQGLFFLWETLIKKRIEFEFSNTVRSCTGYFLFLFGWLIYPVIFLAMGKNPETMIVLGLPCPTTILTFGIFLMATKKLPKYLIVIPVLWSLVGTSAAFKFGVYPDYMLIISAFIMLWFTFVKKSSLSE